MKFLLTLIMCSYTEATCLPPFTHPEKFRDAYDCLLKGYDEADKKIKEIGREDIKKVNPDTGLEVNENVFISIM